MRFSGVLRGLLALGGAVLLVAGPVAAAPAAGVPQQGLHHTTMTIESGSGPHHYRMEVANTPKEQETGMMFRKDVPPGTGMLFPLKPPRQVAFWMKNTPVSLDIIFIGPDRRILNIVQEARPFSEATLLSAGVAAAVAELAGGEAQRQNIRAGDRVHWESRRER